MSTVEAESRSISVLVCEENGIAFVICPFLNL